MPVSRNVSAAAADWPAAVVRDVPPWDEVPTVRRLVPAAAVVPGATGSLPFVIAVVAASAGALMTGAAPLVTVGPLPRLHAPATVSATSSAPSCRLPAVRPRTHPP
jgi:hypothetical protein